MKHYLYGKHSVLEALKATKRNLHRLFLNQNLKQSQLEDSLLELKKDISISYLNSEQLKKLCGSSQHQNVVLEANQLPTFSLEELLQNKKAKNIWVALSQIQDVQNIGAILRSCVYFDIKTIFLLKHKSPEPSATISRISAGAMEKVNFCVISNLSRLIDRLKKENFWVIGTSLAGSNFTKSIVPENCLLILGNEHKGITRLVQQKCDFLWKIQGGENFDSLNVSASAAIFLNHLFIKQKEL